jgi:hypothetical protein
MRVVIGSIVRVPCEAGLLPGALDRLVEGSCVPAGSRRAL